MWIMWIIVGLVIGWLIPQPQLTWDDHVTPLHGSTTKVGVLKYVWLWTRDKAGMN